jgi:hypothetical protein
MKFLLLLAAPIALLMPAPAANAQLLDALVPKEKSAVKEGFVLPAEGPINILVFRPDVQVAEQTTGGLDQPNADWTNEARALLMAALTKAQAEKGNDLKIMPELSGEQDALMSDYRSLFRAVADAAVTHKLFPGNRLPSKREKFDWTLGPGAQKLGDIGGGEYGLFVYTYDSYGNSGRKAAQIVGAMFGAAVTSGTHIGYAGLVDLKSGDLVWMNADIQMGGDVRTEVGADKRVKQLLEDFPMRGVAPVVTVGG